MLKDYASSASGHISLGTPLRAALCGIPAVAAGLLIWYLSHWRMPGAFVVGAFIVIAVVYFTLVSGIRVAAQWERGVVLRFGRYKNVAGPGVFYVIPFVDAAIFVDQRVLTLNIPGQQVITLDNVPAAVEGVLFFKVVDPEKAVVSVQDYRFAVAQYAQSALRDVIGNLTLDQLLSEREKIQEEIAGIVGKYIAEWGLKLDSIRLQDIEMPEDLKRIMSRQASAEREKRATITKAEGDKIAADNLAAAAGIMARTEGAMMLRTLQTIDGLGASTSNTVILFPADLNTALARLAETLGKPNSAGKEKEVLPLRND